MEKIHERGNRGSTNGSTTPLVIIALCGLKGSGKSHLAQDLARNLDNTVVLSYSRALQQIFQDVWGKDWKELEGDTKEKYRAFMTGAGDAIKTVNRHYFAEDMVDQIRGVEEGTELVIIDDLRYEYEAEALKSAFASPTSVIIMQIGTKNEEAAGLCDKYTASSGPRSPVSAVHSSETMEGLDGHITATVYNDKAWKAYQILKAIANSLMEELRSI